MKIMKTVKKMSKYCKYSCFSFTMATVSMFIAFSIHAGGLGTYQAIDMKDYKDFNG